MPKIVSDLRMHLLIKNLLRMTLKIPFIQASLCLTGVDSYTILETKKVREIGRGYLLQDK